MQFLNDKAYEQIKFDIVRCRLPPGSEVSEAQLALSYGYGKAPVRMGLLRLSQDGLVKALPRRGYRIAPVTLKDVYDVFEMRLLLEPYAARAAAGRVDAEELRVLDDVCQRDYAPTDPDSRLNYLEANRSFHVLIARASGNSRLAGSLAQLLDEMTRILFIGLGLRNRTDEMQHEHKQLVDALVAAEGAAAEQIARDQILASRKMVMDAIVSSTQFQNVPLVALGA